MKPFMILTTVAQSRQVMKLMTLLLVVLLFFTSAMARDKKELVVSEKQVSFTELDFRRMILEGNTDTLSQRLSLGEHLWDRPLPKQQDEFMIFKLPISTGFSNAVPDQGIMIFKKRRTRK